MSIARLAVRLATVAALRGQTLAGTSITDSAIPPIDTLAVDEPHPFVVVYTDDGEFAPVGRDLKGPGGTFSLVLEIAAAGHMQNGEEIVVPMTDDGMEVVLDLLDRQIRVALSDPNNTWAEMWRELVHKVSAVRSKRGASAAKGVRFAVRQIEMNVHPIADPPYGPTATGIWARFLDMIGADDDLAHLEPMLRASIESDTPPLSWELIQSQLGMTKLELDAMQLSHRHDLAEEPIEIVFGEAEPVAP